MVYAKYPCIPGHEFSAEVIEVGDNDFGIQKGQVVTCNPYFNCGGCYSCERGILNACMSNETMGVQREGAFSEYITMPVERIYDGGGLDPKSVALIEPFCISYHGVKRAKVKKGDKVLIVGSGCIGLLAAIAAKLCGAIVYMSDVSQEKLDFVNKFGVDGVFLNSSREEFEKNVDEITQGRGFDVTIEAVGLPSTFEACVESTCYGGNVCLLGVSKTSLDFNFNVIQKKELNIHGSRNALKADFEEVIEIFKTQNLGIERIITHEFAVDDVAELFKAYENSPGSILKAIVKF